MKNILPVLAFALALTFCNCGGESDDEPVTPTPVQPEPTPTPEPTQPEEKPDEKPDDTHDKYSVEATKLLNYLKGIYGKKMLSGTMYGQETGEGYIRINIACPRSRMVEGLERMLRELIIDN
jgi:hypothetical protein